MFVPPSCTAPHAHPLDCTCELETTLARNIDACPHCGANVTQVDAIEAVGCYTQPCGHRVAVTMHADRIELERA